MGEPIYISSAGLNAGPKNLPHPSPRKDKNFKIVFVMYNILSTERMSVMLLSALAKKYFPQVECDVIVWSDGRFEERIKDHKPDIIAYSTMTGEHSYYLSIAKEVKTIEKKIGKKIFQIMGGPHCTFAPEVLQGSALDAIGVGECDEAWVELLSALEAGRSINGISNIVTQENFENTVKPSDMKKENYVKYRAINMTERTCKDPINHNGCLDYLPFLDWELYIQKTGFEKTNAILKRTIMTRRGCPFPCTYCFNRVFNALYSGMGKTIHNYSIDRVIEECKWVGRQWPTEFWKIYDDIAFFSSKGKEGERLREFAEKWRREINLPFFVLTRADLVSHDPDILKILKEAGCRSCTMSIEGGNEYVRNRVLERSMPNEDIIAAHNLAWDLDITTFSNVIFSVPTKDEEVKKYKLPEKSIDRDIESVALAIKAKVHFLECPQLYPYPGTKLGKYCQDAGFFDGDLSKLQQSYQNISPLDCFTDKEKRMSQNLALLAMWCVYLGSRENPFIRKTISPLFFNFTTGFLIKLPWLWCTKLYFIMYDLLQQWLCVAEIYRPKYRSPFTAIKIGFWERLRYEYTKQFPKALKRGKA